MQIETDATRSPEQALADWVRKVPIDRNARAVCEPDCPMGTKHLSGLRRRHATRVPVAWRPATGQCAFAPTN